jgi:ABC-type uncharacterized transport system substrate-binding protein
VLVCSTSVRSTDGEGAAGRAIILSFDRPIYMDAATAAAEALKQARITATTVTLDSPNLGARAKARLAALAAAQPDVVLTSGTQMTSIARQHFPDATIVAFMVPNAPDAAGLLRRGPDAPRVILTSADPDPNDYVDWVHKSHPAARKVAVLCSERSANAAEALVEAARGQSAIQVEAVTAAAPRFADALRKLEADSFDGVIMIPDSAVYDASTVRTLLLWGARNKRAVWAFSENVVQAGAFAGMFCEPKTVGARAARIAADLVERGEGPTGSVQYVSHVQRAFNDHAADVIGVNVDRLALTGDIKRVKP